MTIEEQLRAFGAHVDEAQEAIAVADLPTGGRRDSDTVATPRRRLLLIAAAAVLLVGGVVSLAALRTSDPQPMRPAITSPSTVPEAADPTTRPTSTLETSPTVTPNSTVAPSESGVPPASTEPSDTDTANPGSEEPPALPRPVPGQTQQSVVGDIAWTLLEGDASNVPEGTFVGVDGWYLGGVHDGRTWRSPDGIEWELVDLGGDGVADVSVYGEFEFQGETWARSEREPGLVRWDGETFVPVDLPDLTESPVVDLDGLRISGSVVGSPVVLGDELIVPVTTILRVPWNELYFDGARAEWTGDPQSIRIVDTSRLEEYFPDRPLPVVAVLSADFIDGEPGRIEFRDVDSDELVTTVEAIPGVDPTDLLARIIDGQYREILIGDPDGLEVVEPPGGWGVPADWSGAVVPIDGGVLGLAQQASPPVTIDGGLGADAWELWTSIDARSWNRLDLPTPSGSIIDIVELKSNGSTAVLTIYSRRTADSTQDVESWSTLDGRQWQAIDATLPFVEPAEWGWLASAGNLSPVIALSADGRTWQEVHFGFPDFSGGGGSVVGHTIFVTNWPPPDGLSATNSLWIGRVTDR